MGTAVSALPAPGAESKLAQESYAQGIGRELGDELGTLHKTCENQSKNTAHGQVVHGPNPEPINAEGTDKTGTRVQA